MQPKPNADQAPSEKCQSRFTLPLESVCASMQVGSHLAWQGKLWKPMRENSLRFRNARSFFFELSCARHYNCGSHWAMLVLSLLDNGIKRKGQGQRKTRQTKPPNNNQNTQPVPDQSSKRWNKVRQAQALTANYNPRLSQRLQQEIVKGQCSV